MKSPLLVALLALFSFPALAQMTPPVKVANVVATTSEPVTSISQVKDVKPTDRSFEALQALIERYGVIDELTGGKFRPNDPLTRGEFVKILNASLDRLNDLAAATSAGNDSDKQIMPFEVFASYDANKTNIVSMSQVKDVPDGSPYFNSFQSLIERCGVIICDVDKYCRPDKNVTEKEFYTWITNIFAGSADGSPSVAKRLTRGEFAMVLNSTLDAMAERIDELEKLKTAKPSATGATKNAVKKSDAIASLEPLGKARIIKKLLSYSPDNTCFDTLHLTIEQRLAFKDGGIWGDYEIKDNDIGDIVYEAANTCKTGEKLVLLRIGTAIITISEKGIKRIK